MSHDNISDIRKVLYGDFNPQRPDTHDEDYYVPELSQLSRRRNARPPEEGLPKIVELRSDTNCFPAQSGLRG